MSAGRTVDPIEAEFLFDVALTYRAGMEAVQIPNIHQGAYLGSGDGSIRGPDVHGTVRWDLNEITGERACQMFFSGVIETDDGAVLAFETIGFGRVSDPAAAPDRWVVSASLQITTDDPRYAWLSELPAAWVGELTPPRISTGTRLYKPCGSEASVGLGEAGRHVSRGKSGRSSVATRLTRRSTPPAG